MTSEQLDSPEIMAAREFAIKKLKDAARPLIANQVTLLELKDNKVGAIFGMFGTEATWLKHQIAELEKPCLALGISQGELDHMEKEIIREEKKRLIDQYLATHPDKQSDY